MALISVQFSSNAFLKKSVYKINIFSSKYTTKVLNIHVVFAIRNSLHIKGQKRVIVLASLKPVFQ